MSGKGSLVSIIVPVYNVEKYLDRCVASLVQQTYQNIEIILVDDGSSDVSPGICDEWVKRDKRVKTIHKSNAGAGMARNSGMEIARGDWITFVDADDYLDRTAHEKCMKVLQTTKADICFFSGSFVDANGRCRQAKNSFPDLLQGKEIRQQLLPKCYGEFYKDPFIMIPICWMGIYKKDILLKNRIEFVDDRVFGAEDAVFTADACYWAQKVAFINESLYYYCENEASITHSYAKDRFACALRLYNNRKEDIRVKQLDEEISLRVDVRLWNYAMGIAMGELRHAQAPLGQRVSAIYDMFGNSVFKPISGKNVTSHMPPQQRFFVKAVRCKLMLLVLLMVYIRIIRR